MVMQSIVLKGLEGVFSCIPLALACYLGLLMSGDAPLYVPPFFLFKRTDSVLISIILVCAAYTVQWLLCLVSSRQGLQCRPSYNSRSSPQNCGEAEDTSPFMVSKTNTGGIAGTFMNDVMMVEHVPGLILPKIVMAGVIPSLCLGVLFLLDWRIGVQSFGWSCRLSSHSCFGTSPIERDDRSACRSAFPYERASC